MSYTNRSLAFLVESNANNSNRAILCLRAGNRITAKEVILKYRLNGVLGLF